MKHSDSPHMTDRTERLLNKIFDNPFTGLAIVILTLALTTWFGD
jgi:hypothetical protein